MQHLRFYFSHSINDLRQNGRRTLFALFCVAAGVAAIIALRTLALTIGDTLNTYIAATNKGDIRLTATMRSDPNQSNDAETRNAFSRPVLDAVNAWAKERNIEVTTGIGNVNIQVAALSGTNVGRPQFISSVIIDSKVYPYYGAVKAIQPPGAPLSQLFPDKNSVVVSENLAKQQGIKVGDKVRVGRTTEEFTVRGIVPTDVEGLRSLFVFFFGFAYFDQSAIPTLNLDTRPDEIYLKVPPGLNADEVKNQLFREVPALRARSSTLNDLRRQYSQIADIVDRLIVALGLIALLIGSTGIIHTMLVVVRRRTLEIAVLKTIGIRGGQITILFMVEALIMGVLGSLFGALIGIPISIAVNAYTQQILPLTLQWRIYPEAILTGAWLGIVVTFVFGFLPVLTASRVRPAVVLRPNDAKLPPTGCFYTLLALLIVVVGVGLIVGNLLNNTVVGLVGVTFTLTNMGICIGSLWFVVVILGALPSFRSVDLRLALRGIGEHRFRTASTLFALIIGMFALSSITLISSSVPKLLSLSFQNALGGNVLVFTPISLLRPLVNGQLNGLSGVERFSQIGFYSGDLISINGDTDWASKITVALPFGGQQFGGAGAGNSGFDSGDLAQLTFGTLSGQDVKAKGFTSAKVVRGRALNIGDAGKAVVVVRESDITKQIGLKPGDKLQYRFGRTGDPVSYEVVGILPATTGLSINTDSLSGNVAVPLDALPRGVSPTIEFSVAQVQAAKLNESLVALTALPGVFAIDVGFIDSLISNLINLFAAVPTVVTALSLFAGAVIIANTVSLATLERRQRIGVLKAIGMTGRRALGVMFLENGIVGLVGGFIGVGVGILTTYVFSLGSGLSIFESVEWGYVAVLMALAIGITLVATALSAWTAVREKPLNVLRYE